MNDENTQTETATQQDFTLPESFQGNTAFEGIDSMGKLAQGFADTHQAHADLVAGQPVIPENVAGYEIAAPEGQELDAGLTDAFKSWAHEGKLTNESAQMMAGKFNEYMTGLKTDHDNAIQAGVDNLKKEWGTDFDGKAEAAQKGLNRFFIEAKIGEAEQKSFAAQFGNNPTAVKLFHSIGTMISESPHFGSDGKMTGNKGPGRTEGGAPILHDYSKTMK